MMRLRALYPKATNRTISGRSSDSRSPNRPSHSYNMNSDHEVWFGVSALTAAGTAPEFHGIPSLLPTPGQVLADLKLVQNY